MTDSASASLDRIIDSFRSAGRRRFRIETVWSVFLGAYPELATAVDKRERLEAALHDLAAVGAISLPSPRSFDRGHPRLPMSISINGVPTRTPSRISAADYPWRPELAWAASLRLSTDQIEMLKRINAFLRDGGTKRPSVPSRERSVDLFGDEKALDRLARTSLMGPGRLTYELLRCHVVHPPFCLRRVGEGDTLLVVENHHTYESLGRAIQRGEPIAAVVYGAGNHFISSVAFGAELDFPVRRITYFGDIDTEGLRIPVAASAVAESCGLPKIEPAGELYELLFEHGRPSPCASVSPQSATRLARWLPASVRDRAIELLSTGQRLAQEWIGTEVLANR